MRWRKARALEALHLALPPSGRLMRILGPIVLPSPAVVQVVDAEIEGCCAVGPQIIRDQPLRSDGVFPQKFAHQFQRGVLVALGLDQHIQNLALSVDSPPEIDHTAVDFQIEVSGAGEFRPRALSEPDVILSHHPAPIVRPLLYGFALSMRVLPSPVALRPELNNATPSLQPYYRTFITTTGCSAPVPRIGTLILAGTACLDFSLRIGATGSRVPHRSLDQSHAAFMPDAAWAEIRPSPDSSQVNEFPLVSTSSCTFRHLISGSLALVSLNL